jgi:hypothetical protein
VPLVAEYCLAFLYDAGCWYLLHFWQEHHITIPAVNYFHWRFIWSTLSEQDRRARAASHCRYHHRRESGSCFAVLFLLIMGDSYVFCVGTMAHTAAHRQIKFYNFNLKIDKKTIILRIPFFLSVSSYCLFHCAYQMAVLLLAHGAEFAHEKFLMCCAFSGSRVPMMPL